MSDAVELIVEDKQNKHGVDIVMNDEHTRSSKTNMGDLFVKDHFTLSNPTSSLTFKNNENLVVQVGQSQIVLEKSGDNIVNARQIVEESPGYFLLRGAYTLIAFLCSGFLFVFCTQLVLFLFLGLAIESGLTSNQKDFSFLHFVGTLFAIPMYMFAMTNAMTIAMAFTQDTWNGHKFLKTIFKWDSVIVDWISTIVFNFVPFVVGGISLHAGTDKWWEYTLITWFSCVFAYFLLFAVCTIYYEIDGCLQLIRYSPNTTLKFEPKESKFSFKIIKAALLMKIKFKFSGTEVVSYTVTGSDSMPKEMSVAEIEKSHHPVHRHVPLASRFTKVLVKCGLYKDIVDKLQYDVDLVRGYTPYVTSSTWGLEKLYCRNRDTRYIAVVQGKSALTKQQVLSSFVCFFGGFIIQMFMFVAVMVWLELPAGAIGVICGLYALWSISGLWTSAGLAGIYKRVADKKNDNDQEPEILYQVQDDYRITEPSARLCWVILALECLFLFWFPLGALLQSGNYPVGFLFLGVSVVTFARRYLNASIAVKEFGSLNGIESDNTESGFSSRALEEDYREKHRLSRIISDISSGRKNDFWMSVFGFFIVVFCGLFMAAVWKGSDSGSQEAATYTTKFEYPGSGNLEYTSCSVGGDITTPDNANTALADFAFLAAIAYEAPDITNTTLQEWFDPTDTESEVAIDHQDVVDAFKAEYEAKNGASAVTYKLLGFPNAGVGIVTIRGTSNGWDALADAQLWSSAAIAQWLRALVPLGAVFTPVLEYLVEGVSWIQADSLAEVAFYKQTTAFVEHVKTEGLYNSTIITGHSLGGGLAMISGAQTEVPAIALSGPNAVISRRTFDPPVSIASLEKYTFNIVPDRDVVPRLDDLSQNYQRIKCRSGLNDPLSCHFGRRSMCEILYQCGSKGRPIPCHCANDLEAVYKNSLEVSSTNTGEILAEECPAKVES